MVARVQSRTLPYLHPGLYRVEYFDKDWNELEHLCVENAGAVEALDALKTWFRERDLIRVGKVSSSALIDAVAVSVRRQDAED